jgi:hypothetical protein
MSRATNTAHLTEPDVFEHDEPLVYALDRRGPNDPRFGSIHALIGTLAIALAVVGVVVL